MSIVPVSTVAEKLYIHIDNLPLNTTWAGLKDFVHNACGEEARIQVDYAEVYAGSCSGYIRVIGEVNYKRAYNFLLGRVWKGCILQPSDGYYAQALNTIDAVPVTPNPQLPQVSCPETPSCAYMFQPQAYPTAPQYGLVQNTYNVYPTSPAVGYAHGPGALLPTMQLPGMVQRTDVLYHSPAVSWPTNYDYLVPTSGYGSNSIISDPSHAGDSSSKPHNKAPSGPVVLTEARGVHISKLPYGITDSDIRHLVESCIKKPHRLNYGGIENIEVATRPNHTQKGYALVTFETREMACVVVEALNGTLYRKHPLKVKLDHDRKAALQPMNFPALHIMKGDASPLAVRQSEPLSSKPSSAPTTSSYGGAATNTKDVPRDSEAQSSSCPWSSNCHASAADVEEVPRHLSAPEPRSPAVVDGTKFRPMAMQSANVEDVRAFQLNKGLKNRPNGDQTRLRKARDCSPSGKRGGEDSKGKKKLNETKRR